MAGGTDVHGAVMFGDPQCFCVLASGSSSRSAHYGDGYTLQHEGNVVAKGVKPLPDKVQALPANPGHCIVEMHCDVFFYWTVWQLSQSDICNREN